MRRVTRIQYMSDLHLEKRPGLVQIRPRAKHLLLLGDIGHTKTDLYRKQIEYCSQRWSWVGLVMGNHEHYGHDIITNTAHVRELCKPFKNVSVLEQNTVTLSTGLNIAGCTLWTRHSNREHKIIQYKGQAFTNNIRQKLNYQHAQWLQRQIESSTSPLVIATHHLPIQDLISKRYKHWPDHDAFANNLDDLLGKSSYLRAWFCGHSHDRIHLLRNNVYLGINAGESRNEDLVVDIEH